MFVIIGYNNNSIVISILLLHCIYFMQLQAGFSLDNLLLQDDNASHSSSKELREENLTFQVAYEMNKIDNETRKYPCNMWVWRAFNISATLQLFYRIKDAKRLEIAKHVATNSEVNKREFH